MATKRSFGTIRKLPSGRWQVRYRRHGRELTSGETFATKADAHAHLSAIETNIHRGYAAPDVGRVRYCTYASTCGVGSAGWWRRVR